MTVFWSLAAIMVMVALLFVLPPLLRNRSITAVSQDDLNTNVIRQQLDDLDADLKTGKLDKAQYDAARSDIERELLYDLGSAGNEPVEKPARSGRWITLLIIPAIPLCAVLLYQMMGSAELIDRIQQARISQSQPAQQASPSLGSIEDMVDKLAARLQQQPDDLKGWVMLARSYAIMKRYSEAEMAYANALRLGGENADLLTDYVDTMVMADGGAFNEESSALLLRALELEPDNLKALWLAGHWKNQYGDYQAALDYWQRAAAKLPPDSKDVAVIESQISDLQAKLGIQAEPVPATTVASTDTGQGQGDASLTVQVSLDAGMAAAASPEDTVFIFARAAQGPRMPLAIVRTQVKDLPATVTLDDSMAMTPQMVLSNFEQVTVGARVSKTGNAMPASGDLQGSVTPVDTQSSETIQVTIDSKVP